MTASPDYLALKAFLRDFTERFVDERGRTSGARALPALEDVEREEPSRAPASLRMAVNNCMELSGHWPYAQVAALDAELGAKGMLTLSQVRHRVWGRYAAIVKHRQIRSEADFQVVRAALADRALADELPSSQRELLQAIQAAYEKQHTAASIAPTRPGRRPGRPAHARR